jgi:hypothetical protein
MNIVEDKKNYINLDKLENLSNKGDSWIAACPGCRQEGRDKQGHHLKIWPNGAFHCIVDDSKLHNQLILSLVGTQTIECGIIYKKPEPKIEVPQKWPLEILSGLIKNHEYWNNRGISNETMDYFEGGVAYKGFMKGRYTLPIFNKQKTHIIGFTGRALSPDMKPKWKHKGEKSSFVFPYIKNERYKKILLVESPGCNLKLWDNDIRNTKCLFGTNIGPALLKYLIETNPEEILIGTNNELDSKNKGVGNKAAEKLESQLLQFFGREKIKIALPPLKDFGVLTNQEIGEYKNLWKL